MKDKSILENKAVFKFWIHLKLIREAHRLGVVYTDNFIDTLDKRTKLQWARELVKMGAYCEV